MYQTRCTVCSGNGIVRNIELNPPATSGTGARRVSWETLSKSRKHIKLAFIIKLTEYSLLGIFAPPVLALKVTTGSNVLRPS